jgi:hypothetical protein
MTKKEKQTITDLLNIGFEKSNQYKSLGKKIYTKEHGGMIFIVALFWFDIYTIYNPIKQKSDFYNCITNNVGISSVDELKQLMYLMTKTKI